MGAGISSNCGKPLRTSFGDIPESCIAEILRHLDPPQICNLALLSKAFRRASSADFVWESRLPPNYVHLMKKVLGENPQGMSKKEIYARLCQANNFDGGHKEFWLEKRYGGICFAVSWQSLRITGIDDRRYWKHLPDEESRFQTIAYLQQIWWFEVDGEVEFEFPAGRYSIYFRIQLGKTSKRLGRKVCNIERVHGWDVKPVRFQLSTSDGQKAVSECCLYEPGKWVNYHVGDFMVEKEKEKEKEKNNAAMKVKFSMTQIDCTHTKGGLCLDSVLIFPAESKEKLKNF